MADTDLDSDFDEDDSPMVDDLDAPATPPASNAQPAEPPKPRFSSVYEFVTAHLADHYRRDVSGQQLVWCPQWWAHGEAVSRLEALWRAWEQLRLDGGTAMATWWKDYADPTMATLFDPQGPFAGCSAKRGHAPRLSPLPCEPMPDAAVRWLMSDPSLRPAQPKTPA